MPYFIPRWAMVSPEWADRARLASQRHLRHDEPEIGPRLERDAAAGPVHHDFLEQLHRGLLLVKDGSGLGVERLALLGVEGVARLLHELVEAVAGLAPHPVFSIEPGGVEDAPEAPVG